MSQVFTKIPRELIRVFTNFVILIVPVTCLSYFLQLISILMEKRSVFSVLTLFFALCEN